MSDIKDAIKANATAPKRARGDEGEVESHPLPDQIAADKYVETAEAAKGKSRFGLISRRTVPPGTA